METSNDLEQQIEQMCLDWKDGSQHYLITHAHRETWWMQAIILGSFIGNSLLFCFIKAN